MIAITHWATQLPLLDVAGFVDEPDRESAPSAKHFAERLGRKGLQYKDEATRLALCAVHRLLGLPPGVPRAEPAIDPRVSVVVCSNLGNVAAVHQIASRLRRGQRKEVSPLEAPGASSNVIASSIAIWFGYAGPNVMVCSGASASLDALEVAALLLRSRRAERVVVVGVEPSDPVACAIYAQSTTGPRRVLRGGAVALLIEREPDPCSRPVWVGPIRNGAHASAADHEAEARVFGPGEPGDERVIDLRRMVGDLYGAMGVLQLAAAATSIRATPTAAAALVVCGDEQDCWRSVRLHGDAAELSV